MHVNLEELPQRGISLHGQQQSVRAHEVHGECGLTHAVPGGVYVVRPEHLALLPVDVPGPALTLLPAALPGAAIAVILPVHWLVARDTDWPPCNTEVT